MISLGFTEHYVNWSLLRVKSRASLFTADTTSSINFASFAIRIISGC